MHGGDNFAGKKTKRTARTAEKLQRICIQPSVFDLIDVLAIPAVLFVLAVFAVLFVLAVLNAASPRQRNLSGPAWNAVCCCLWDEMLHPWILKEFADVG